MQQPLAGLQSCKNSPELQRTTRTRSCTFFHHSFCRKSKTRTEAFVWIVEAWNLIRETQILTDFSFGCFCPFPKHFPLGLKRFIAFIGKMLLFGQMESFGKKKIALTVFRFFSRLRFIHWNSKSWLCGWRCRQSLVLACRGFSSWQR